MVIPDANVTLISKDEMRVSIPAKAAKFAELVMTSLFDDDDKEEYSAAELELALPNVVGFALEKIVEFLIHYEQNEFALIEDTTPIQPTFSENIKGEWYVKYMESLEAQTDKHGAFDLLYEVKYAANFMAVTPLLEMMCLWMMHKVNDMKTGEDIRSLLRINPKDDEEVAELREKCPWMYPN